MINHTTARLPDASIEAVLATIRDTPEPTDAISLNPGQIVFALPEERGGRRRTLAIPNSYEEVCQIAETARARDIALEPTALDTGFLSNIAMFVEDGVLETPRYLLLEFAGRFGDGMQLMPGDARSYAFLGACVRELFPGAAWVAHGIEESVYTIADLAIEAGDHLRIGFEDRVTLPDDRPAGSNAEMVAWAAERARALGRPLANPTQARALMLGAAD